MASTIRSMTLLLTRRPSALMTNRSIGSLTTAVSDENEKKIFDKKAKFEMTLTLQGLKKSDLRGVIPLVKRHLNVVEANNALHNYFVSVKADKKVHVDFRSKITLEGFDTPQMDFVSPCVE